MPPVAPMLAKPVAELPEGPWSFEPKWDGFRTIVFRDGDEVELGSRRERPMTRYFPEVVEAVRANLPPRCVVDAEIVVPDADGRRLDFDALLLRIHPAASRVALLAAQTPARLVAFDLLALDDRSTTWASRSPGAGRPWSRPWRGCGPPVHLTPATTDRTLAAEWLSRFEGAGLDGLVAKSLDGVYEPDRRVLAQGQAHPHRRLCGRRLPAPQARRRPGRLAAAGPVHRRRGAGHGRGDRRLPDGSGAGSCSPSSSRWSPPSRATPGTGAPGSGRPRPRDAPGEGPTPAAGTRARSCRSCPCGPSGWSRSATTTWRAAGSATPPSSSAGAPTATPAPAPTTSSRRPSATTSPTSWRPRAT